MAESHKFSSLPEAEAVFPDLPWKRAGNGDTWVYNSKEDEWAPVSDGQYIVKIADRYEVHDEEPARAKPAEPVEPEEESDDE